VARSNEHGNQRSGSIKRGEFLDYTIAGNTARGIPYCPNFFLFLLPDQRLHIVKNIYIYTHTHTHTHTCLRTDCICITVATKYYRMWNILTQIWNGAKCWLDIYHCSFGLAVTGRTRNIGQNVLPSSFRTASSSSPSYRHILFLLAFLEEAFVRNITIMLYINYIIITH